VFYYQPDRKAAPELPKVVSAELGARRKIEGVPEGITLPIPSPCMLYVELILSAILLLSPF
jgi:hypothetical protein